MALPHFKNIRAKTWYFCDHCFAEVDDQDWAGLNCHCGKIEVPISIVEGSSVRLEKVALKRKNYLRKKKLERIV